MASISVIIPNYNRANLIGETLDNLLCQTRAPDELIVVDDGSTDNSVDEIRKFGDRIQLITQENAGPASARNRGLSVATGEFIQFFDSDDLCSLNKLESQAAVLTDSGADFAYGPWLQARLEDGFARYPELPLQQGPLPGSRSEISWFLRGWVIVFQCCLFRRSLLEKVGHYRTDLMPSEDSELLFRMLLAGAKPVYTPDVLVLYRLHDGGQISRGGMAVQRRATDWLKYTTIVADALERGHGEWSQSDENCWRRCVWHAKQQARRVAGLTDTAPLASRGEDFLFQAKSLEKRLRTGLSRRITGSSFGRAYQPKALSLRQSELIRTLGYVPVRDRTA